MYQPMAIEMNENSNGWLSRSTTDVPPYRHRHLHLLSKAQNNFRDTSDKFANINVDQNSLSKIWDDLSSPSLLPHKQAINLSLQSSHVASR